ncbi:hypothetical protein E1B28_008123 [Marasmius oreades]|uniref:Uncharacterized protein n=1 Tax=Marasmius oreades TaxID=181124 RepID=A0A9P7RXX2_9AGAR|nr:uncharacterized protein E1B28_008123 [Marasmius oreades]KAG7091722.1 hypothetical protein E1B28_008123 [Marasmius oreades]
MLRVSALYQDLKYMSHFLITLFLCELAAWVTLSMIISSRTIETTGGALFSGCLFDAEGWVWPAWVPPVIVESKRLVYCFAFLHTQGHHVRYPGGSYHFQVISIRQVKRNHADARKRFDPLFHHYIFSTFGESSHFPVWTRFPGWAVDCSGVSNFLRSCVPDDDQHQDVRPSRKPTKPP